MKILSFFFFFFFFKEEDKEEQSIFIFFLLLSAKNNLILIISTHLPSPKMANAWTLQHIYKLHFEVPENSAMRLHKAQYRNWHYDSKMLQYLHVPHKNNKIPELGIFWTGEKMSRNMCDHFLCACAKSLGVQNTPKSYKQTGLKQRPQHRHTYTASVTHLSRNDFGSGHITDIRQCNEIPERWHPICSCKTKNTSVFSFYSQSHSTAQ